MGRRRGDLGHWVNVWADNRLDNVVCRSSRGHPGWPGPIADETDRYCSHRTDRSWNGRQRFGAITVRSDGLIQNDQKEPRNQQKEQSELVFPSASLLSTIMIRDIIVCTKTMR